MDSKGYYKTLGVDENADADQIKKAFRKLSAKYHPDKQVGKSEAEQKSAEEKFKEVNEAYQVLSDSQKRSEYDNGGFSGFGDGGFGNVDFNDLFGQVFGNFGHPQYSSRQQVVAPGGDIRIAIQLSIEDVYNGVTKKLKYNKNVRCATCHGSGGITTKVCPTCKGTGTILSRMGIFGGQTQRTCPHCNGTGKIPDKVCPTCNGNGFSQKSDIVEVVLKPGVANGEPILSFGGGNEAKSPKGQTGNLIIVPHYAFDENIYEVVGLNVKQKIYVPYYDLILGTQYTLELPNGTKQKISIPKCIEEGKILRLTGKGINRDGNIGDYYVEVHYAMPTSISEDEQKYLEDIKNLHVETENTESEG